MRLITLLPAAPRVYASSAASLVNATYNQTAYGSVGEVWMRYNSISGSFTATRVASLRYAATRASR